MIFKATKKNIDFIVSKILEGNIFIFPTDTVYGIGCIAMYDLSIEKIYKLKGREKSKSLLLNVHNLKQIEDIAYVSDVDKKIIDNFMPGPLSLILKVKQPSLLSEYVIKDNKIGVRIPDNKILLSILKKINLPIVSTSCNKSGKNSCLTALEAQEIFGKDIIIIDNNSKLSGISSTIVETFDDKIKVVREGAVSLQKIKDVIL